MVVNLYPITLFPYYTFTWRLSRLKVAGNHFSILYDQIHMSVLKDAYTKFVEVVIEMSIIRLVAILTIVAGIIGWIITFSVHSPASSLAMAWKITWIVNPIGSLLSFILLVKKAKYGMLLLLLNLLLFISVFPMWFLGDLINMLTGR